jgi:hypothetical protein
MRIVYQSPNYNPDAITNRYLHIDLLSDKVIVSETVKTVRTNNTYRSYELPEEEYPRYSKAIAKAQEIKRNFPYEVEFKED